MDKRNSSKIKTNQAANKLQSISPQKFGKGAFANLSYTPSKLADNVLYKDATNMKKMEQSSSKIRQSQALNGILKQKIRHLQQQRAGIEQSLSQQITMYKKMNRQLQNSNEQRIKQLQKAFNDEIQKIIKDKQQQAKYVQSQQQLMENRIFQLQKIIAQMKDEFNNVMADYEKLSTQNDKLGQNINKLTSKNQQLENIRKMDNERYKKQVEQLNKINQKQKQKFNSILVQKQNNIENLNKTIQEQKQKNIQITKNNAAEYTNLQAQRNKLKEALEKANLQAEKSKEEFKKHANNATQTTTNFQRMIEELKKKLEQNQRKSSKQKQNWAIQGRQLRQQILILRKAVQKSGVLTNENVILSKQVNKLQELLLQTSLQMQRCKEEFTRQDIQKQALIKKLRELDVQNEFLYKQKLEMEDEAKCWRQTYYKSRR